jgi:hypothetical protein
MNNFQRPPIAASAAVSAQPDTALARAARGRLPAGAFTFKGKAILVRFVIDVLDPDHCRFEQAFSADAGATWEVNWIATDTRIP